ncbi:MAG: copper amine oxidase N-terminal domain-containing protein [Defluviitaleaceae bacterium]|nr:copper amine oxidase N-terminal domain-containing protein [Defluviitaleaceae bacterium]
MKKIKAILAMVIVGALLLSMAAFATETERNPVYTTFEGTVTMLSDNYPYVNYIRVEGAEEGDLFNFLITENTFFMTVDGVLPISDIQIGDELRVYFIQPLFAASIYPPQREASVFVKVPDADSAQSIFFGRFDENLVSYDNYLRLNIDGTLIIRQDGTDGSEIPLTGRDLAVVYTITTRSIPAQTTPELIVIHNPTPEMSYQMMADFFANEAGEQNGYVDFEVGGPLELDADTIALLNAQLAEALSTAVTSVNGEIIDTAAPIVTGHNVFVPLRAIAEALGYDVFWEAETASIALGAGVRLQIGSYEYIVGRMAPITLDNAPFISNNMTFVPLEFFNFVLGYDAGYMFGYGEQATIIISDRPESHFYTAIDEDAEPGSEVEIIYDNYDEEDEE